MDLLLFVSQIVFTSVPGKFCITLDTFVTTLSANLFITYHFKGQNPYDDDSNSPEGTLQESFVMLTKQGFNLELFWLP